MQTHDLATHLPLIRCKRWDSHAFRWKIPFKVQIWAHLTAMIDAVAYTTIHQGMHCGLYYFPQVLRYVLLGTSQTGTQSDRAPETSVSAWHGSLFKKAVFWPNKWQRTPAFAPGAKANLYIHPTRIRIASSVPVVPSQPCWDHLLLIQLGWPYKSPVLQTLLQSIFMEGKAC